jgi:sarcosine oxidase subunit beta
MTKSNHCDVAIIGGGLMGAWTALFLRRRHRSVTIIEKGSVGEQSSGVNFGNIRLQGRHPSQFPLSLRSLALWEDIEDLVGERCEFASTGHLYLALASEQIDKLVQTADQAGVHGIEIEVLGGKEARARWPWLGSLVHGGSFSARDATANPRLVTPAVVRAAKVLGANVLEHVRASKIEQLAPGFRISTDRGTTVECDTLINCAGAWGAEIAARFGEPVPLFAAGPPQFVTEPIPFIIAPSVQSVDGTVIFRQVARGNVVVAGFPRGPTDPIANRAPVPPAKTLATMNRLAEVAPALASAHVIRVWSGIEGYLPDMLPVIGPSGTTPGLLHAFGFCGHGFQLGPGVGLCLTELAIDGASRIALDAFSITRFGGSATTADDNIGKEFDAAIATRIGGSRIAGDRE